MVGVSGAGSAANKMSKNPSKSAMYSAVKTTTPNALRLSDLTKTKQHQQLYNVPKRARIVKTAAKIEPAAKQKKKHNLSLTQPVTNN